MSGLEKSSGKGVRAGSRQAERPLSTARPISDLLVYRPPVRTRQRCRLGDQLCLSHNPACGMSASVSCGTEWLRAFPSRRALPSTKEKWLRTHNARPRISGMV